MSCEGNFQSFQVFFGLILFIWLHRSDLYRFWNVIVQNQDFRDGPKCQKSTFCTVPFQVAPSMLWSVLCGRFCMFSSFSWLILLSWSRRNDLYTFWNFILHVHDFRDGPKCKKREISPLFHVPCDEFWTFFSIFLAQKLRLVKLLHLRKFTNFSDPPSQNTFWSPGFFGKSENCEFWKKSKNYFLTFFSGVVGPIHNPRAILRSLVNFQPNRVKIGRFGFSLPWVQRCHVGGSSQKQKKI